jgi:hypothetical protein
MSRVSGKMHSSRYRVTPENPHGFHGNFDSSLAGKPYVKRTKHHFDALPRPSQTDIVGSHGEIDWSIRTSYIPVGFLLNLKEYESHEGGLFHYLCGKGSLRKPGWIRPGFKEINPTVDARPPKGFTFFGALSHNEDKHVRNWTKFANEFGIKYHKDRYYEFPKGMIGSLNPKSGIYYKSPRNPFKKGSKKMEFELLKMVGAISHKRSEYARIRRAARRVVSTVLKPLSLSDLLVQRKCASAKERRLRFIKDNSLYPAVNDRRGRCHKTPDLVVKAIHRLLSNEERVHIINVFGEDPVPELPRTIKVQYYPTGSGPAFLKKGTPLNIIKGKAPLTASTIPFIGEENYGFSDSEIEELAPPGWGSIASKRPGRLKKDVRLKGGGLFD